MSASYAHKVHERACLVLKHLNEHYNDRKTIGSSEVESQSQCNVMVFWTLQSNEGWQNFTAGWLVGGLSGVAWGFFLTKVTFCSQDILLERKHGLTHCICSTHCMQGGNWDCFRINTHNLDFAVGNEVDSGKGTPYRMR